MAHFHSTGAPQSLSALSTALFTQPSATSSTRPTGRTAITSSAATASSTGVPSRPATQPHSSTAPKSLHMHSKVYTKRQLLGRGTFGTCHLYEHPGTGHRVAIKCMIRRPQHLAEMAVHRRMRHPHIVAMLHELQSKRNYYLVMEPCRMSLQEHVQQLDWKPMFPAQLRRLFAGPVDALAYIHRAGYVHRDLKLSNLLLSQTGRVQICDFGMAGARGEVCKMRGGTWSYMAPEAMRGDGMFVRPPVDVWSMAVCVYRCATGRHPFADKASSGIQRRILMGLFERRPMEVLRQPGGDGLMRVIEWMLEGDEERRPTAEQVLADEFFAGDGAKGDRRGVDGK